MKFKANFQYKPNNFQMDDCQIEKVIDLSAKEFAALMTNPLRDHPAVAANKDYMYSESGVMHCLLAMERGGSDGLLIESEGYDFPRYAAFVPGIRDIVNAAMDRAADYIIRQGIEKSGAGSRYVCFEELEEHLGLTIQEDSGLDNMLQAALERRPETASVDMSDGGITMEYRPEFCRRFQAHSGAVQDIRLKDILPLLKGGGAAFLCHETAECSVLAENLRLLTEAGQQDHETLLNARISEICPSSDGVEVLLTGVEPEELVRFNEAYDNFVKAEQSMGPVM